jgi:DNA-directed RNA polymerase specialized sigma24 family protein
MTEQRAAEDALAAYVGEHWADLVAEASLLCADPRDGESIVLAVLARLDARRRTHDEADLEVEVRRRLVRACIANDKRSSRGQLGDVQLMDVVATDGPVVGDSQGLVRRAVGELPARQRAALVLRYLSGADDGQIARLIGCSAATVRGELAKALGRLEDTLGVDRIGAVTGDGSSRTEAILRRALAEAPALPLAIRDPAPELARHVRRLKHRRAALVSAAAAVIVVVGATAALDRPGSTKTPVVAPPKHVVAAAPVVPVGLVVPASSRPSGITSGGGYLWTVELHPNARRGGTTIERRDLATGQREKAYRVSGEDFGIAYGLGRVWTWGASALRPLAWQVNSLDPVTGIVHTATLGSGPIEGVAFAGGRAWFTQAQRNRVVLLSPDVDGRSPPIDADGASDIAALSPTSVVVLSSAGQLLELPSNVIINHTDPSLTLVSSTPSYGVWIGHGGRLSYQPAIDSPLTVSLRLPLEIAHVVGDPTTGAYVATESSDPERVSPYLVYYSPQALKARHPRPTARLDGDVAVSAMSGGVDGGLVYVTTDGAIVSWNPSRPG